MESAHLVVRPRARRAPRKASPIATSPRSPKTSSGRLWIGTFGSGINLLDRATGRVTPVRHVNGVRGSLSDDRVMAMLEGSDGDVWVGTMGGGLNRFDPPTLKAESSRTIPPFPRRSAPPA